MRQLSPERQLLEYLKQLAPYAAERQAVQIHTSLFSPLKQRAAHLQAASHIFDTFISRMSGRLFVLSNDDLIFIYKENFATDIATVIKRLQVLISDPLSADQETADQRKEAAEKNIPFFRRYRLREEYEDFLKHVDGLAYEAQVRRAAEVRQDREAASRIALFAAGRGEALTPAVLARIEGALETADLSNILRRQTVCLIKDKQPPQPLLNEIFISISDLRQTLLPQIDLLSNRWLFQHLTETLDRRVLSLLHLPDDQTFSRNISLNINVATILSKDFLDFDAAIDNDRRRNTVLELQKTDIFSDLEAYSFARDFVHERGYRICIDGLNHLAFPFVNRKRLKADLVKLQWQPDLARYSETARNQLSEFIRRYGAERTILCHCDQPESVAYGQKLGLTLFQGRHVGDMLTAAREYFDGPARLFGKKDGF